MSITVAEGVVVIGADADKIIPDVVDALNRGKRRVSDVGGDTGRGWMDAFKGSFLGNALADLAGNVVSFVGQAIGAGVRTAWDFAMQGIDVASGLEEARTAINQVFGSGANTIFAYGETASKAIGQSNLAALKASQTFGIYGRSAGLADEANAEFAKGLVGLASDFASFYDSTPEEAIEAIGAALRGEAEPIRRYGILLDDATLKQRALAMGLIETTTEALTPQQRVLAAQAEIFAQGEVAMGDFARTSDGLANSQRILAAQFEDSKAKLGEALLPAMLALTDFANENLIPILDGVIEQVGPMLADAAETTGPVFVGMLEDIAAHLPEMAQLAGEILPQMLEFLAWLLPILIDVGEKFGNGATQIGDFFSALGESEGWEKWSNGASQIDAWFAEMGPKWDNGASQIQDFFTGFGNAMSNGAGQWGAFGQWVASVWGGMIGAFSNGAGQIGGFFSFWGGAFANGANQIGSFVWTVSSKVSEVVGYLAGLPGRAAAAVGDLGGLLVAKGRALIQGFLDGISSMWGNVSKTVGGIVDFVAGFFPNSPAKRGPLSGAGWTKLRKSGSAIMDQFGLGMQDAKPAVPFDMLGFGPSAVVPTDPAGGLPVGVTSAAAAYPAGQAVPTTSPRSDAPLVAGDLIINEAEDPLGTEGRIAAEFRKYRRR